jgi:hypothetical protein
VKNFRYHWRQMDERPWEYGVPMILAGTFLGLITGTILEWWLT